MYIKFSDLIDKNFTEASIRRLITYTNADIMNIVIAIITGDDITDMLNSACTWFATSLHVTYATDRIQEILNDMQADIQQILSDCADDKHFADTAAFEIGTNSETSTNYSVVERMILICAAAQHMGWKFDFEWNL